MKINVTAVLKKLRLENDASVLIVNAPEAFKQLLAGIKYDVSPVRKKGHYDYVQVFGEQQAELERLIHSVRDAGKYDCVFWACYPKGTGSIKSDMKRETVWKALAIANLNAVSQVAIDETWSALRGRPNVH